MCVSATIFLFLLRRFILHRSNHKPMSPSVVRENKLQLPVIHGKCALIHLQRDYTVHGSLCPQLSFQQNRAQSGFIPARRKIKSIDDTSTNPVSAFRATCVLFKIFASSLTLHKNAGLDVLF